MARSKARVEFSLSVIELLFSIFWGWGATRQNVSKLAAFRRVGHLEPRFQGEWSPPANILIPIERQLKGLVEEPGNSNYNLLPCNCVFGILVQMDYLLATIRCLVIALLLQIRYVTSWPWPLTFWLWSVVIHGGSRGQPSTKFDDSTAIRSWVTSSDISHRIPLTGEGRSFWGKISGGSGRHLSIYWYHSKGNWMHYNLYADSFYIMTVFI